MFPVFYEDQVSKAVRRAFGVSRVVGGTGWYEWWYAYQLFQGSGGTIPPFRGIVPPYHPREWRIRCVLFPRGVFETTSTRKRLILDRFLGTGMKRLGNQSSVFP